MNWDQIEGKWKQLKGSAREKWGDLTNDDLEFVAGHRDRLVGRLQERYGYLREDAQRRADDWAAAVDAEQISDVKTRTGKP